MNRWVLDTSVDLFREDLSVLAEYESDKSQTRTPRQPPTVFPTFPASDDVDILITPLKFLDTPFQVSFQQTQIEKAFLEAPMTNLFEQRKENLEPNFSLSPAPHRLPQRLFSTTHRLLSPLSQEYDRPASNERSRTPNKATASSHLTTPRTPLRSLPTSSTPYRSPFSTNTPRVVRIALKTLPFLVLTVNLELSTEI